jgi:hypothetical protein
MKAQMTYSNAQSLELLLSPVLSSASHQAGAASQTCQFPIANEPGSTITTKDNQTQVVIKNKFWKIPAGKAWLALLGLTLILGALSKPAKAGVVLGGCADIRMSISAAPQIVFEGDSGKAVFTVTNTSDYTDKNCDISLGFKITGINLGDAGKGYHASDSPFQDNPLDDILTGANIPAAQNMCSGKTLSDGKSCTFAMTFQSDDPFSYRDHDDTGIWHLTNIVKATTVFGGVALNGNGDSLVLVTDLHSIAPEPSSLLLFGSGILGLVGFLHKRMIT